jgi:diguanylate cyclase (GGDEF)-like protein
MAPLPCGWRRFRRPPGVADRTRWSFTVVCCGTVVFWVPLPLSHGSVISALLGVLAGLVLICSWLYGYVTRRVPAALDLVDAAAMGAVVVSSPTPFAVFGVAFPALWLRSASGSMWRAILRCGLYATAIVVAMPLWSQIPGHVAAPALQELVGAFPVMLLTVIFGRQLGLSLLAHEENARRDSALAALGSRLIGVTDLALIREHVLVAATDICAATPGLRILEVRRRSEGLEILSAVEVGSWAETSGATIVADGKGDGVLHDPRGTLDAAVGTSCDWICLPVREDEIDRWILVGAPKAVPVAGLVAVRSLVNQLALALTNARVHHELTIRAATDGLTGLANRTTFHRLLASVLGAGAERRVSVLFVDLDHFKDINDTLGHHVGDDVLRAVASRLRATVRDTDVCARLGGDEFAVLLFDQGPAQVQAVARRVVSALADVMVADTRMSHVGASVGVATAGPETDLEQLLHQADVAMYTAKTNGKNQVRTYQPAH